ncbi:MAG TPA: hypothetical protein VKT75_13685, partial [Acidobacteriaceae bacterium]|nr:hypothetical protein [Acidobacteriaceae bacterium]
YSPTSLQTDTALTSEQFRQPRKVLCPSPPNSRRAFEDWALAGIPRQTTIVPVIPTLTMKSREASENDFMPRIVTGTLRTVQSQDRGSFPPVSHHSVTRKATPNY